MKKVRLTGKLSSKLCSRGEACVRSMPLLMVKRYESAFS